MGVQALLPMLKSVMDHVNVAKYRGKTVGIDAAGWLYKGCYSCAVDVVQGKDTDVYVARKCRRRDHTLR
jgi:exonuclease 1